MMSSLAEVLKAFICIFNNISFKPCTSKMEPTVYRKLSDKAQQPECFLFVDLPKIASVNGC